MSEPLIGTVNVAGKVFTIGELGHGEELRLGMLLKKMYAAESGNSYRRAKEMIEEMPRHLQGEAIAACVRSEAAGELPGHDAMLMARTSPKGVALELWMRARKHMEGIQQRECEAIVTESNCLEVLSDMIRELTPSEGGDESKS